MEENTKNIIKYKIVKEFSKTLVKPLSNKVASNMTSVDISEEEERKQQVMKLGGQKSEVKLPTVMSRETLNSKSGGSLMS